MKRVLLFALAALLFAAAPASAKITTDTITANEIAANAITTSELNADAVTSTKIAAGTIVASDIAVGTITADKLNVTNLNAITANIGDCVFSGSNVVCGAVTLNSSGIGITSGTGSVNSVKWTDGSMIYSSADQLLLVAGEVRMTASGAAAYWTGSSFQPLNSGKDLGDSSHAWDQLWLTNELNWASPPTTTSDDDPVVYSTGNVKLYRKTNGVTGTCTNPTSIDIQSGIIVACS